MKTHFLCLFFWLGINLCLAQQHKYAIVDTETKLPINYSVQPLHSKIFVSLSVDTCTRSIIPFNPVPNDSLGNLVYLEGASEAKMTIRLRKDSLQYYRYTIVENDHDVITKHAVPSGVDFVWNDRSTWPGYLTMDLGIKAIKNKKITIKIYRLPDVEEVTTIILYNKPLAKAQILTARLLNDTIKGGRVFQTATDLKDGATIVLDQKPNSLFIPIAKTDLDFVYRVQILRRSGADTSLIDFAPALQYDAEDNNPYFRLGAAYFEIPGEYSIYIVPHIRNDAAARSIAKSIPQLHFKVLQRSKVFTTGDIFSFFLPIMLLLGMVTGCVIYLMRKKMRNRLQAELDKAEVTRQQLDQIRSQLNPHFVYNSLSGIQNLINQQKIEDANTYLNKFARLTRSILNDANHISIEDEISLLDDYLAMEQLRWSFKYVISVEKSSDLLQVDIPTMLLQPFVENAVKHSMSVMGDSGKLVIDVSRSAKDLRLSIKDNGKGFDLNQHHAGLGLKMCQKRIDLINQLYPECPLVLHINSGESGTLVTLTLNNWL